MWDHHDTQHDPRARAERFARNVGRGGGPRRHRGPGYGHDTAPPSTEGLTAWLAGRLPDGWFTAAPEVTVDRDEVGIVGTLTPPTYPDGTADVGPDSPTRAEADRGRIRRFREETREGRVEIARELEARFGRSVAWGAVAGDTRETFTNLSVPVMTRLRQPERQVLDTLVDAGVARSRSDALAWCVRLVGRNADSWLTELRDALQGVEKARAAGPDQEQDQQDQQDQH